MKIDKSIKVGDIVATNASNVNFVGQRVFGKVKRIDFEYLNRAFYVHLILNANIFNGQNSSVAYPYNEPGRPYEDAYLVKATPEECEAHRTGVMPSKKVKYKKGVWYKHESDPSFRKCNKDSNDRIPYNERIIKKQYEIDSGTAHWNGIEADMNEVSKYLPDGHPDKIEEKKLKASEAFHDFQIGQKFIILGDRPAARLNKGDIVTCFHVSKNNIDVTKDDVSGKPISWNFLKSTIGEYYEPYYKGGGIIEQIESSKNEEYLPIEDLESRLEIVVSKNDTFDPIVKAPIVI